MEYKQKYKIILQESPITQGKFNYRVYSALIFELSINVFQTVLALWMFYVHVEPINVFNRADSLDKEQQILLDSHLLFLSNNSSLAMIIVFIQIIIVEIKVWILNFFLSVFNFYVWVALIRIVEI